MGSKTLYFQFETEKSLSEVRDAAIKAFTPLGGQIMKVGDGLRIIQGKEGVQFGFVADFEASVMIQETSPNHFEIVCNVNWKMNTFSWICLIIGIFAFGILWIFPLFSLFIDPSSQYNNSLFMIPKMLN